MILIERENAFKIFYLMMAADGTIGSEEKEKLAEIGLDLFGENYQEIEPRMVSECQTIVQEIVADPNEAYDILSDQIDKELDHTTEEIEKGLPSRQLIWNLLLMAYSDGEFAPQERRLLQHIVRRANLEKSVFLEMEQYISTADQVEKELRTLSTSMEPYALVRPVVDELETRLFHIKQAVTALIEDELAISVEKLTVEDDVVDKAQAYVKELTDPMMQKVNEQTGKIFEGVKQAAAPAANEAGRKFGKAFKDLSSKFAKPSSQNDQEQE